MQLAVGWPVSREPVPSPERCASLPNHDRVPAHPLNCLAVRPHLVCKLLELLLGLVDHRVGLVLGVNQLARLAVVCRVRRAARKGRGG